MKVQLSPEVVASLEEITGKKITRNADQIIREVTEMVEEQQKPDSKCWIESDCSEQEPEES